MVHPIPVMQQKRQFSQLSFCSIDNFLSSPAKTHPRIKQGSLTERDHSFQPHSPIVSLQCFTWLLFTDAPIRSPQPPSSSFPHPGQRALSACVPASREDPGIWLHSDPDIQLHPLSTLPLCNVAAHTSCGRRWSSWVMKRTRSQVYQN